MSKLRLISIAFTLAIAISMTGEAIANARPVTWRDRWQRAELAANNTAAYRVARRLYREVFDPNCPGSRGLCGNAGNFAYQVRRGRVQWVRPVSAAVERSPRVARPYKLRAARPLPRVRSVYIRPNRVVAGSYAYLPPVRSNSARLARSRYFNRVPRRAYRSFAGSN